MMNKKYIYLYSFFLGFLYVFGFNENPSVYLKKRYREQQDAGEMAKDWRNIGFDILKSYEQVKATKSA